MTDIEQALKSLIEALEYHTEQTRPIQKTIEAIELGKSALAEIEKCEPVANRNEAVSHLWESIGLWSAYLASNGEQAELSPPSWLVDAIKNATSPQQREWVDLPDTEHSRIIWECTKLNQNLHDDLETFGYVLNATKAIEAKLKQLNMKG